MNRTEPTYHFPSRGGQGISVRVAIMNPSGPGVALLFHSSLDVELSDICRHCHIPALNVRIFSCSVIHSVYQYLKCAGASRTHPLCPRFILIFVSVYKVPGTTGTRARRFMRTYVTYLVSSNMWHSSTGAVSLQIAWAEAVVGQRSIRKGGVLLQR